MAEAMEPCASVSAIAHRIGIHPSQLFGWRRDARAGQRSFSQDPAVKAEAVSVGARAVIELVIGDIVVRAGADIDEAHLRCVIRAVRSA